MKKKATFSREQLSKSKTFGYGKDLVLAVLEDRDYTMHLVQSGRIFRKILNVRYAL